ncbi:enterochelin esterase domain-containing protein [Cumulibacter soli]|uniref:enterochelin esterase domain-containing protein n=1 Tax=Cumulibacter soli TaxID=2546344 RepID=UPI0010681187|nr:alpha/beta hydrolase-fold protein [Cumulibacter soli]
MNAPSKLALAAHPRTTERTASPAIKTLSDQLRAATRARHEQALAEFWATTATDTPLIEPVADGTALTLLWRDAEAAAVLVTVNRVTNDLESSTMQRVPHTDVWHASYLLENDWRGSYTVLAADAAVLSTLCSMEPRAAMAHIRQHGVCDPRNRHSCLAHGHRRSSVAALKDAPVQRYFDPHAHPRGTATEHVTATGRRVWSYLPAEATSECPIVVVLDGDVWHASQYAATTIDALIDDGAIRAPLVLMVDPGPTAQRVADLHIDGPMAEEIVRDLLPWARSMFAISEDPADVVVSGESLGALTALKVAFDHPQSVGCAVSQSASLWQHDMLDRAASAEHPVRVYLAVGTKESVLLEPNRALRESLTVTPHELTYVEYNGGHDMACWRGGWAEGVRQMLARS